MLPKTAGRRVAFEPHWIVIGLGYTFGLMSEQPKPQPRYEVFLGTDLDGTVHRIVKHNPPELSDFISYAMEGRSFPANQFFRALGVSMYLDRGNAEAINGASHRFGDFYAELDIRSEMVFYADTGGPGHITVWAPAPLLLHCVLNCD
jgi:hypothetical protein